MIIIRGKCICCLSRLLLPCASLSPIHDVFSSHNCANQYTTVAPIHQGQQDWQLSAGAANIGVEEVQHTNKIAGILEEVRIRAIDDDEILQFLQHDHLCCRIQPSNHLINNLLRRYSHDWKSAFAVFRWAGLQAGYRHSNEAYDKMVDILGKMKHIEKMNALVQEMREIGLISLNTVAKIMRRLAGAGRWNDAIKTFDDLGHFGLDKNVESMNLLLDTLCKERKVEVAREVFLELKTNIPPNAHTFNIFIHGWCKVNRIDEAEWTVIEMKGYGIRPCVITYTTVIEAYCKKFNYRKVHELLDEMKTKGCSPNVVTYTTVMHSLAKSKEFEEALEIFERMKADGCQPDTLAYNSLIYILGNLKQVSRAIHIFEKEMPSNGVTPNVSTYNTLISLLCHHSDEQSALRILREMEGSRSCKPNLLTFNPLLKLCFKLGKTGDNLSKLLNDMVHKHNLSLDLATYSLLIHGLCRAGKCVFAYHLFEEMISLDITPRYLTCSLLLEELENKNMRASVDRVKTYTKQLKNCYYRFGD